MAQALGVSRTAAPLPHAPEFPGASAEDDAMLKHVVFTGTVWFCGAIVAALLPLTGLLAAGWRPSDLRGGAVVWWLAVAVAFVGVLGIAWSGCPVVTDDPGRAAGRKSVTIRAGLVLLLAGFAVATVTVLLG